MNHPLKDYYKDIYRSYDLVNRVFTFGRDSSWRKRAARECLANNPSQVLDVCTGTGDLILEIAKISGSTTLLTGYDFTAEMLDLARIKANKQRQEIHFIEGNVAEMTFEDDQFDTAGIAFGIRNLIYENSNAGRHLAEIYRVIHPGGRFVILESSKPKSKIWRTINNIYLQFVLPYLGGILSGNLHAYKYLARSSKNYYTISEMRKILEAAGFYLVKQKSLFLGSVMLLVAEKRK